MPSAPTFEQIRLSVLDALSGRISPPHSVHFDNYANLKIGVRAALAARGILEPQMPFGYLADDALTQSEEITYKRVYDSLIAEGVITEAHGTDQFTVALLPAPFSESWQFIESLSGGGQGLAKKVQRSSDGIAGVLKIPHSMDAVSSERFRREVSILQNTNHPSVVRLLDVNLEAARGAIGYVTPLGISYRAVSRRRRAARAGNRRPRPRRIQQHLKGDAGHAGLPAKFGTNFSARPNPNKFQICAVQRGCWHCLCGRAPVTLTSPP